MFNCTKGNNKMVPVLAESVSLKRVTKNQIVNLQGKEIYKKWQETNWYI